MDDQDPGGISPLQQMVASGAGAVVTSLFMTPLDVVKVRLQSQRPSATSELTTPSRFWSLSYTKWKCLLYCNGVLEPLYLCPNGTRCATWFQDPTRFTGTLGDDRASYCYLLHCLRPTQGLPVWSVLDL
uniref:Mitochondrial glutathione transporter SLC25A39 n=1 Tax=Mus musculus TaxID=10090 RepID=D6RE23_MOUSE